MAFFSDFYEIFMFYKTYKIYKDHDTNFTIRVTVVHDQVSV